MSFFERSVAGSSAICMTIMVAVACGEAAGGVGGEASGLGGDGGTSGPTGGGTSGGGTDGTGSGATGGASFGTGGEASPSTGGVPSETGAPLFLAQGHLGRTMVSCDLGETWVADATVRPTYESADTTLLRCFDGFDCDHKGSPGRGLAFGNGTFFATFGWGETDGVYASRDGVTFAKVLSNTTFGGLAFADGHVVAGARNARYSADAGGTWSEEIDTGLDGWNVRRVGQTTDHGGRVILVGEAGDAVISDDGGASWRKPSVFPSGCGAEIQGNGGIAGAGGVWLVVGGDGSVCRSTDGGETFSYATLGEGVSSHLTHDGTRFVVYGGGSRFASVDGENWTEDPVTPAGLSLGAIESDGEGRIVGVKGGWMQWYENQKFYFSDDGLNFTEASAPGGHPMRDLAFGRGTLPEVCR